MLLSSCRGGSAGPGWPQPSILLICSVALKDILALEADSGVVWSFTTKPHAPDWAVWMESEPGWRYSIRVCVGCTTDTSKKQQSSFTPCPVLGESPLIHSVGYDTATWQRWRAMNEVITTSSFWTASGPSPCVQPPWPVNHTLHPGGCVDLLQKAQPSKGDSRRSVWRQPRRGKQGVDGEASKSLPTPERRWTWQKQGESLLRKLTELWHIPGVSGL